MRENQQNVAGNRVAGSGNIAVAKVQLQNGVSYELRAGSSDLEGRVPGWTEGFPDGQRLLAFRQLQGKPPAYTDAEYKLLDAEAHSLSAADKGLVAIYTERPPCNSCNQDMVLSFLNLFPEMEVRMYYGLTPGGEQVFWYSIDKTGKLVEKIINPPANNILFPPFK